VSGCLVALEYVFYSFKYVHAGGKYDLGLIENEPLLIKLGAEDRKEALTFCIIKYKFHLKTLL
jgi:hypothetical protein